MSDPAALVLALCALAVALAAAVARPRLLPEAAAAAVGAGILLATGAIGVPEARHALAELAPTVAFLAALLVLADGCRRDGLFDAIGRLMASRARGGPRRLLGLVFAAAVAVTAVLGLDATAVLLTPIALATAARMRVSPRPHVYACGHLANSASLLLPVSNLTNLLAFHASGLSFTHFAAAMALPTLGAVAVEWVVLSRFFAGDLTPPLDAPADTADARPAPWRSLAVLALTLAGFVLSSPLGVAPVWFALAGAAAIAGPALARGDIGPGRLLAVADPGFLVFVLALGVVVAAAGEHGLASAVADVVPDGTTLLELLVIAGLAAVLANVVNNLPATLILVPVTVQAGPAAVLAALIGVNVGPNVTYAGSLATLLWRRVLQREGTEVHLGEFVRVGALTVPAGLLAATVLLWLSTAGLGLG